MSDQPTAEKTAFRTVFEVSPAALEQVQAIADTFQYAIAPATVDFDFGEISRAASAIPDSSTVKIVRGWGLQETAPVGVMVMSLREAVRQALSGPFGNPSFWERAEAALTDVFVGLGGQKGPTSPSTATPPTPRATTTTCCSRSRTRRPKGTSTPSPSA